MTDRGKMVVLEGVDYSGKTTIANMLMKNKDVISPDRDLVMFSEPTKLNGIRDLILNEDSFNECFRNDGISEDEKSLIMYHLFMASRVDVLNRAFRAMAEGKNVIMDRSYLSTLVYQYNLDRHLSKGPIDILRDTAELYEFISNKYGILKMSCPDATYVLDINLDTYVKRMNNRANFNSMDSSDKNEIIMRIQKYRILTCLVLLFRKVEMVNAECEIDELYNKIATKVSNIFKQGE